MRPRFRFLTAALAAAATYGLLFSLNVPRPWHHGMGHGYGPHGHHQGGYGCHAGGPPSADPNAPVSSEPAE